MTKENLKTVQIVLVSLFVLSSVVFFCVYFPLTYQTCTETINRVEEYIPDHTCFCKNNPGPAAAVARKMLTESQWFKQFNVSEYQNNIIYPVNNMTVVMTFYPLLYWLRSYYPIEMTNKIMTINMDSLIFNDYLNIYSKDDLMFTCRIVERYSNNTERIFFYNQTEICNDRILSYNPIFNSTYYIDYESNQSYREACGGITYCEVAYCSTNAAINIVLFCCSIITTIYTVTKVINFTIVYFFRKKYKDINYPLQSSDLEKSIYQEPKN